MIVEKIDGQNNVFEMISENLLCKYFHISSKTLHKWQSSIDFPRPIINTRNHMKRYWKKSIIEWLEAKQGGNFELNKNNNISGSDEYL